MDIVQKSERSFPLKPEWKIILDHLIYQDETMLYRICRRMIIHLDRLGVDEIHDLKESLTPSLETRKITQRYGQNWPKPKGSPFNATEIYEEIFQIADNYIRDEEITYLLTLWMNQEHLSFLSRLLEKGNAPLAEVVEAVKRYLKIFRPGKFQPIDDEIIGLRVALISRFLSENLQYINIAKNYIKISEVDKILDRAIGPANGNGKFGGKSAGMILARQILLDRKKRNPLYDNVYTPKSRFLTSDGLSEFVHYNAMEEFVFTKYMDPNSIKQEFPFIEYIFKNSHFPSEAIFAFNKILDDFEGKPIIVRSSSLLEDSFEASFSGKYKSLFLTNLGTKEERLEALMNAITEVYASTFGPDPIEYRKERGLIDFREEMGVLIQEVVGTRMGKYFLPSFAGVAYSYNEFRWSPRIKKDDGVVRIVAGLGTRAVDRTIDDYPVLVAPGQPGLRVNTSPKDAIKYSQQYVDVINMETNNFETVKFKQLLEECNYNYPGIEKIVSFNRMGMLVDPVSNMVDFSKEDLVITFNNLIKNTKFNEQIRNILDDLREAFQNPVDVEFASNGEKLFLLQCRPQSQFMKKNLIRIPAGIPEDKILFTANEFVNNGYVGNIKYIVYIDQSGYENFDTTDKMYTTGKIVSRLNRILPKRKFILIGPGRWGSKGDIKLGVPVIYSDINNSSLLIEVAKRKRGYVPELSFGTHFFQDLVESNIMYLPLYPDKKGNVFRESFFTKSKNRLSDYLEGYKDFEDTVKLIELGEDTSMCIFMDGEEGKAVGCIKDKKTANKFK